ncbi:MAG: calcium/sodium antiporter [Acidimicrobiia bacterium]|nr:calcium/sodium antiporter [Acidimicrobiia bacterium]
MAFVTEPTMIVALIEVAIGLWLLTTAADEFVEGAANVASALSISPVVIGAVIVGFGTSAPELLVSSLAAWHGDLDLGVGNVVGSNVANLTLVLGAAALIVVLRVTPSVLAREAPLSLLAVLLFAYFTTGGLQRWEGTVLLGALVGVLTWIIVGGRIDHVESHSLDNGGPLSTQALRTGLGLLGTVAGAQLLVWGASAIATMAGISGGFVGFTLVAIGTSLPELVTAVAAARKGETEIILGNLLGSNIFNSLAVGGAIAAIHPGAVDDEELATIGIVGMALVAFIAWAFMVTRKRVHRIEAVVLLVIWLASVALMARGATEPVTVALGLSSF